MAINFSTHSLHTCTCTHTSFTKNLNQVIYFCIHTKFIFTHLYYIIIKISKPLSLQQWIQCQKNNSTPFHFTHLKIFPKNCSFTKKTIIIEKFPKHINIFLLRQCLSTKFAFSDFVSCVLNKNKLIYVKENPSGKLLRYYWNFRSSKMPW